MLDTKISQSIIDEWLKIEFSEIARRTKLLDCNYAVSDQLVLNTLRFLDNLTANITSDGIQIVIGIIALMWELVDREQYDLRDVFIKFLARIGYSTSAIIIDDQYNSNTCSFHGINSFFDRLTVALNQKKFEVTVGEHMYLLTQFQHDIWKAAEHNEIIGVSAPTSAGKTFSIMLHTLRSIIEKRCDIVYIVPTLSLLNQITSNYNKMIKDLGIDNVSVTNGYRMPSETPTIYVLTQEKAISSLTSDQTAFEKPLVLVVDEIQNIERMTDSNDTRSKILYDTISEFQQRSNVNQVFFTGPRISDLDTLGESLFKKRAQTISTVVCPVFNLTYSIRKSGSHYYLRQYCSLRNSPYEERITNTDKVYPSGRSQYTEDFMEYLNRFVSEVGEGQQNIIFSPTSKTARQIALSLKSSSPNNDPSIKELLEYYSDTVSPYYAMCTALQNGAAYHHGKLPMHVRRTLEAALEKKLITNVACTTTLMQGVNLPAQNVIIRNPHLYVTKRKYATNLTNYEMANLRGRAGRLLKDFVGRTYVLDEDEFVCTEGFEQTSIFTEEEKSISPGYEEKYESYKDEINDVINTSAAVSSDMSEYGYLVTYIRQMILRYGQQAKDRVANVGITLEPKQVAAIIAKLDGLVVPREVCIKNRYWDPFVLNSICQQFKGAIPNHPTERGAKTRLNEMMRFLRDTESTRHMYMKYVPEQYQRGKNRSVLCSYAMQWAQEERLSSMFSTEYFQGEEATDRIEDIIELLQNTVSYNLTLLLKPIFDIRGNDGTFLTCMQAGAYNPVIRRMIEMGVPRETALQLKDRIQIDESQMGNGHTIESLIQDALRACYDTLPIWLKTQIEFLI